MIARSLDNPESAGVWERLSSPLPDGTICWRQDGRAVQRDGKFLARFVPYIEANAVLGRLDAVCPGNWDLTLELLPVQANSDGESLCAFKARLQILGVIREDVGQGDDYKNASTDAFKRAAVRYGIAHELYAYEQNWVQVDGDGKFAKPLEDPSAAYARRRKQQYQQQRQKERVGDELPNPVSTPRAPTRQDDSSPVPQQAGESTHGDAAPSQTQDTPIGEPPCPKCGGLMWDNLVSKRNPKAPDYKCRSRSCDGVIWPPRASSSSPPTDAGPPLDESQAHDNELPF